MAGSRRPADLSCGHDARGPQPLQRPGRARHPLRRRVLRRRDLHAHLLPADLSGQDAQGSQLPLLRHPAGGRAGGFPPLPPVPSRARPGQRARGRRAARGPTHRAAARGRAPGGRCRPRRHCRAVRAQLTSDPAHRPEGAGRAADSAPAHAPPAAGQATPHRDHAADHRGGIRQRLLEPAPVQRRVHAVATACRRRGSAHGPRRSRNWCRRAARRRCCSHIGRRTTGPASSRFWLAAPSWASSTSPPLVCADGALGQGEGLDPRDPEPHEARAARRVSARPHAGTAGAPAPRAGALRPQRAARPDRPASGSGSACWPRR